MSCWDKCLEDLKPNFYLPCKHNRWCKRDSLSTKLLQTVQKRNHGFIPGGKFTPWQAWTGTVTGPKPFKTRWRKEVSWQHHAPALYPRIDTCYLLYSRLDEPRGRFGRHGKTRRHWDSISSTSSLLWSGNRGFSPLSDVHPSSYRLDTTNFFSEGKAVVPWSSLTSIKCRS